MTTMWGAPLHKRWRGARLRDPRQARFLTLASLKWVLANRAYTPWYLVRYWRLLKFTLANPHIITRAPGRSRPVAHAFSRVNGMLAAAVLP